MANAPWSLTPESGTAILASMLAEAGKKERHPTLQRYLLESIDDVAANSWKMDKFQGTERGVQLVTGVAGNHAAATALPIPSNWMPRTCSARRTGAACALDEVVRKAGDQLVTLVHDLDRFTATESIVDRSISKWGVASAADQRKFNYLVSIKEIGPGVLSVEEYRSGGPSVEFPDGVITNGLPSLALIFHPFYAGNYEMTCEGLARFDGGLAWQVHFRQRDKPIGNRGSVRYAHRRTRRR
jgi:hypothetical protein